MKLLIVLIISLVASCNPGNKEKKVAYPIRHSAKGLVYDKHGELYGQDLMIQGLQEKGPGEMILGRLIISNHTDELSFGYLCYMDFVYTKKYHDESSKDYNPNVYIITMTNAKEYDTNPRNCEELERVIEMEVTRADFKDSKFTYID